MSNNLPAVDKIIKARIDFIYQDCVFLGNLALRLKLVEASWVPTAGVDGKHLYYNPEFIDRLSLSETKFVVAHEVMHCVYEHFLRRGDRDPMLWNFAGDYVINWELKELGIGSIPNNEKFLDPEWVKEHPEKAKKFGKKPMCLIDEQFRNMSTEEVFKALYDHVQKMKVAGVRGSGDGQGGDSDDNPIPGHGTSFDVHVEPGQGGAGQESDPTGKNGPIPISQEELDRMGDEMRRAVMDAAKVAEGTSGGAGNIPMGARRLIKEWTDSKMDWRELLNVVIQSIMKSDYTWQRPSRKSWHSGCYLPGMKNDEAVSVDVAIDTSGSISESMLRDFLSEVRGIMEQFPDFDLRVWCFDTQTYTIHKYNPDNLDDIDDFEMEGGGGTDFYCNWVMMKENEIVPHQFVMFTDGYPFGSWGDEDYCETLFVIHGNDKIVPPFGLGVYYERETEEA